MPRLTLRRHLLALLGYGVLTIIVTYPAAFRLSSHIPGGGDAPWFLWQLWWFKHAIVDLRQSPLVTDLLYYPLTQVPVNWQSPFNEIFGISLQSQYRSGGQLQSPGFGQLRPVRILHVSADLAA